MKVRGKLPSPAATLAFVALVAALSGSAIALPGKNKVDKNDIKRNAVASKQIKNNAVTGADVNEGSLGKVPSANNADTAGTANTANTANSASSAERVGGFAAGKVTANLPAPTNDAVIFDAGGLRLTASCAENSGNGDLEVEATNTTATTGFFHVSGTYTNSLVSTGSIEFAPGAPGGTTVIPANAAYNADQGNLNITFSGGESGAIVTAQLAVQELTNGFGANDCFVHGKVDVG